VDEEVWSVLKLLAVQQLVDVKVLLAMTAE
jgi:hypothetical protein